MLEHTFYHCVLPKGGYVKHETFNKVRLSGDHLSKHDSNHPLPTPHPHQLTREELFKQRCDRKDPRKLDACVILHSVCNFTQCEILKTKRQVQRPQKFADYDLS